MHAYTPVLQDINAPWTQNMCSCLSFTFVYRQHFVCLDVRMTMVSDLDTVDVCVRLCAFAVGDRARLRRSLLIYTVGGTHISSTCVHGRIGAYNEQKKKKKIPVTVNNSFDPDRLLAATTTPVFGHCFGHPDVCTCIVLIHL